MYSFRVGSRRFDSVREAFEYAAATPSTAVYVVLVATGSVYRVLRP